MKKTPLEIKNDYKNGRLGKHRYINLMHGVHKSLFDYQRLLGNTDLSKIEITGKDIVATNKMGLKFYCQEYDKRIAPFETINFDSYEKEYADYILELVKNGDAVFDIGANIGYYSLLLGHEFNKAKIYAFEPIPDTFKFLKKNIILNDLENIKAFNFGFGSKEETLPFYFYKEGSGNASARELNKKEKNEVIKCKIKRIDDFVKKEKIKIDLIKCDVEGAELFVFQGGEGVLKKSHPVIVVEMLRKWTKPFGYHPNETIEYLRKIGYKCFIISGRKLKEFNIMTESTKDTNFIFK